MSIQYADSTKVSYSPGEVNKIVMAERWDAKNQALHEARPAVCDACRKQLTADDDDDDDDELEHSQACSVIVRLAYLHGKTRAEHGLRDF